MTNLKWINLALRAAMELGIVLALGYWGLHAGQTTGARIFLAVLAPALVFGLWSLVDFRSAGSKAEALRLAQELILSGLAATAGYLAGAHMLGRALAAVSIVHHALVYLSGNRLLKPASR